MQSKFKLFIKPDDIGMRVYTSEEISQKMARSEHVNEEPLIGFAKAVKVLFENDNNENNLTSAFTRTK